MLLVLPATRPSALEPLLRRRPFLLLPVLDKPLLAYHLDLASSIGAESVIVMTDDRPEQVRAFAGKGQAWGLSVEVVAVEAGLSVPAQLGRLSLPAGDVRILSADALVPPVAGGREGRSVPERDWVDEEGAVLTRVGIPGGTGAPLAAGPADRVAARRVRDLPGYARVNRDLLLDDGGFVLPGYEVAPGIRISQGCRMSLGAVAASPVLVGEGARVSYRANLGPSVVVGAGSLVDEEATLADSVVLPGTYVGRMLSGKGLLLDGQLIVNSDTGGAAAISDTFLLADLDRSFLSERVGRAFGRLGGSAIALLASPLGLVAWLASERPKILRLVAVSPHVRLAVDGTPERLAMAIHEFNSPRLLLRRLGWLLDVAAGRLSLFGNPPLDPSRAEALEPALRDRWLDAPAGLLGSAQIEALEAGGPLDPAAEAAASVLFASAPGQGRARLLLRGLAALFRPGAWRASVAGTPAESP
jgi:hypothetical protein